MENVVSTAASPVQYRDRTFRIAAALIGGHFITVFGYDKPLFEIMLHYNYYIALAFGFLVGFGMMTLIYRITVWLDKRFDWSEKTLQRLGMQALFGWVLPAVAAFLLAAGYFAAFGFNILERREYRNVDYPVIVFMLLLINVYYYCYYLYLSRKRVQEQLRQIVEMPVSHAGKSRELFIVNTALRSIPVRVEEICYICIIDGTVFLRTFDMLSLQDAYAIPETLKEMEGLLDGQQFFRINRKAIVNFSSVQSFKPGKNQTLELVLAPPLSNGKISDMPDDLKRLHVVSEDRVPEFKKWMER